MIGSPNSQAQVNEGRMKIIDKENWNIEVTNEGLRVGVERRTYSPKEARELSEDINHCLFDWHSLTGLKIDNPECG
jgi:hypothetical protein